MLPSELLHQGRKLPLTDVSYHAGTAVREVGASQDLSVRHILIRHGIHLLLVFDRRIGSKCATMKTVPRISIPYRCRGILERRYCQTVVKTMKSASAAACNSLLQGRLNRCLQLHAGRKYTST